MDNFIPIKGKSRHYLNLLTALVLAAGAITLILSDNGRKVDHPQTQATPQPTAALFSLGEHQYDFDQLPLEFQEPLYQIRKVSFEQQMLVLEQAIVETYIQQQADSQNLSPEAVLQQLFPEASPTEEQMLAFYRENQARDTPPFDKIRGQISTYLTQQNRETMKRKLLAELLVSGKARMLAEAPKAPDSE